MAQLGHAGDFVNNLAALRRYSYQLNHHNIFSGWKPQDAAHMRLDPVQPLRHTLMKMAVFVARSYCKCICALLPLLPQTVAAPMSWSLLLILESN